MEEKSLHVEGAGAEKGSQFRTRGSLSNSSEATTFAQFDLAKLKGRFTFGEGEKLKSKKIIDQLFTKGKSVSQSGFTLVYLSAPLNSFYPAQASFSAPKKNFKHAVDRNRVKRLMREVYRMNKFALYEKLVQRKEQLAIMWVYKGKQLPELELVTKAMLYCLNKI
ncbi:MAG: ribonuclease protein component [Bacteroidota bacterium]|nr:ribonuclease protein component [Bacteroidota bacterium]